MEKVFLIDQQGDIASRFGISKERRAEMEYQTQLIIHEIFKPIKGDEPSASNIQILKAFLSIGETPAEQCFQAYQAGYYEASELEQLLR